MMRWTLALVVLLAGCSRDEAAPEARDPAPRQAVKSPAVPAPPAAPVSLFDADGQLKPSSQKVAWLEIPLGFEQDPATRPRHYVFRGRGMTLEQVRDYLGARMLTGPVEDLGDTVRYRNAMPVSAAADALRFDVTLALRERGEAILLSLDERNFAVSTPVPPEHLKAQLQREQARAE